jgi:Tfp pilus assembly protein PilN
VRYAQVNAVAGELSAPWSDLLAAFEEHGSGDVGLLKLEPDARAGLVRVTGQVRNTRALFGYLRALEADPRLERVVLTNHQVERNTPGMPLRFTLQAGWRRGSAAAKEIS